MNACILVVDDDPEIVGAIAITLEREGYRVLRAYDGMEALDLALDPAVRLILIDVMMPKLDGLSALLRIREKRNLPVIVLSAQPISSIARYVRSSLLEVISQEYIKTAVAKGMGRSHTVYVHALKNALIPVVTIIGMVITSIFTGSMVVETVFSWKGVGKTLVDAVLNRDFPMIQYGVLCIAVMIIVVNLAVDLVYMVIDPRIRIEG